MTNWWTVLYIYIYNKPINWTFDKLSIATNSNRFVQKKKTFHFFTILPPNNRQDSRIQVYFKHLDRFGLSVSINFKLQRREKRASHFSFTITNPGTRLNGPWTSHATERNLKRVNFTAAKCTFISRNDLTVSRLLCSRKNHRLKSAKPIFLSKLRNTV